MNKADLTEQVFAAQKVPGMEKADVYLIVDEVFNVMQKAAIAGEVVKVNGWGVLTPYTRKGYKAKVKGKVVVCAPKNQMRFKLSKTLMGRMTKNPNFNPKQKNKRVDSQIDKYNNGK